MKKLIGLCLGMCLPICGLAAAFAQEAAESTMPPPKVLVVMREFLKPGRQGSAHQSSESAFVQAFKSANWPTHYFAADGLTGRPRADFFVGYDSFEAWEKDTQATAANPTLAAALDKAQQADGDLLSEYDTGVFAYRDDLSLHGPVDIAHMRYFEVNSYRVRPGHGAEWEELVKQYRSAYEKAIPGAHWAMFEGMYGADTAGVFLIFTPMKSLAEVDHFMADSKKVMDSVGANEMKKLEDMEASCVESHQSSLLMFNPKMSYPRDEWVKADPDFWSTK
ncbi:hypothetical protein [Alloacidobacterium sp.]|uniref:hypothetical protein n=1 Tax=Alloacidobacterium sp. TaxID=2951999 RepID=UPI002D6AA01E|nr:hypothetical protein [Alloacidobacterium sp.]HYK34500.1 hypothetical protein [Alloacidobacterium sp.]